MRLFHFVFILNVIFPALLFMRSSQIHLASLMVSMPHGYGKLEKKTEIKPEKAELNMGLSRNRVLAIPVGPYHFSIFQWPYTGVYTIFRHAHMHNFNGKSPFLMGKSTIKGNFQ